MSSSPNPHSRHGGGGGIHTRPPPPPITATALPSPLLRKAAIVSLLPALPLCITHGALSRDVVPALGLLPLFFSASASLFLLVREGRRGRGRGVPDLEEVGGQAVEDEGYGGERTGIEPDEEEVDHDGEGGPVLTHRILVFVVDLLLAAGLMTVLVFTWIRTGKEGDLRPELAMLAAYSTVPLLVNFLIHLFLATREFVAGLAIPSLIEYTAWHLVSPDCPHCGSRLRPDSTPPIPWYETVSRPRVSLPPIQAPSLPRPSLPAFKLPNFSALKAPRAWKVPTWMRGRDQEYASLFVDDEQNERDRYRDEPDEHFDGAATVVATGSAGPALVEEVVVAKKDKKGKSGSSPPLFGEGETTWQ